MLLQKCSYIQKQRPQKNTRDKDGFQIILILRFKMERIIEAAENLANHIEQNYNLITTGSKEAPEAQGASSSSESDQGFQFEDEEIYFEDDESSPLPGMAEGVLKDVFSKNVGPQNLTEHFQAFKAAINWSEPFILGLFCFHVVIIICAVMLNRSKSFNARMVFLIFVAGVVRSAERLNDYGRENWEQFATQDYFDKNGLFVTIMLSVPLLTTCFIMMICYVREASRLVVEVKTMKLKKEMQEAKKDAKKSN